MWNDQGFWNQLSGAIVLRFPLSAVGGRLENWTDAKGTHGSILTPHPSPTAIELRNERALLSVQSKYIVYLRWGCRQLLNTFAFMLLVLSNRFVANCAIKISVYGTGCGRKTSLVIGN